MTALCGGGTSAPKTGAAIGAAYGAAKLAQMLETYGAAWALEVVPLLVVPPIIVSTFCSTDPPAIPTFTSAEANAVLQVQPGADFLSGLSKLVDLALHLIWYDICQCTSGTETALPAAAAPPSGTFVSQPLIAQPATPCASQTIFNSVDQGGNLTNHFKSVPTSTTGASCVFGITQTGGTGGTITFSMQFYDGTGTLQSTVPLLTWAGGTLSQTVAVDVPVGTTTTNIVWTGTGSIAGSMQLTNSFFCNGAPPTGVQQPCCPPDPTTQALLNSILGLVTLIQRQLVPFGSIASTVHSGLSGSGSFAVPRLLGVKVAVTTLPSGVGVEAGNPNYYFDMGFISVSTPDGFIDEKRITSLSQAWYPPAMSDVNLVGYFLLPGVVASITEIEAEV